MSASSQDLTETALAAITSGDTFTGVLVSQSGATCVVLQGGGSVSAKVATQYPMLPGDAVRMQYANGVLVVIGPVRARATVGKVTAVSSPTCTVEYPSGSGITAVLPYVTSYSPAVNDVVQIDWGAGGIVMGKLSTTPTSIAPIPPGASATTYRQTFTAVDSGSYQGSWWTREVYSSTGNVGAWFYGSKIKDTIPDAATISQVRIYLPVHHRYYATANTFGIHGSATKPAGVVAVTSTAAIVPPAASGWVTLPTAWLDNLKANDGGIGINHGGYAIYYGTDSDGLSGALDVTYTA